MMVNNSTNINKTTIYLFLLFIRWQSLSLPWTG